MLKRARVLIVLITALVLLGGFLPAHIALAEGADEGVPVRLLSNEYPKGSGEGIIQRRLANGELVNLPSYAKAGDQIALVITPAKDCELDPGYFVFDDHNLPFVKTQEQGSNIVTITFTMPENGAYLTPYFRDTKPIFVWVGGERVTTRNLDDVLGDGSVSYNTTNKTLTLKNAQITTSSNVMASLNGVYPNPNVTEFRQACIFSFEEGGLTVDLEGENTISSTATTGILASTLDPYNDSENLTITGTGKLAIEGELETGILADTGSVTIQTTQDGAVTAYGSQKGIEGKKGVAINGGTVTAQNVGGDSECPIAPGDGTISIATTHEITTPEGAWVDTDYKTIKYWARPTSENPSIATGTVKIEPKKPHAIKIADTVGGTVTTNPSGQANSGTNVEITATPDENNQLKSIHVVDGVGKTVTIESNTFTMHSTDVTVYAWFVDPTVTVDFGEGHEDFVDKYYKGQTGSTDPTPGQGTDIPFTVNGTKVTYTLTPDSKINDALEVIQSFSNSIQSQADFLDNGVYFMNNYGITANRYEDKKEFEKDWDANGTRPIPGAGVTLHALWAQPTGDVTITVEPLVCGTEVSYGNDQGHTSLDRSHPEPKFRVSGNAAIDFAGAQDWCDTKERNHHFVGKAKGGTDYYAWALANPSFGYFFKDIDTTVTVTNDPDAMVQIDGNGPDAKNYGERIAVFAKVTATHAGDWAETKAPTCTKKGEKERTCESCQTPETADVDPLGHNWGEWKQTKAPTCTEKGTDERVCGRDASHKETREVAIDPAAHNWGEPTYTWSGDNATCTATRSCRNDAGHVETEVAQATTAVTREPTATEAGTRTYTATFNNEAFATRTKDVEIPATGEGDTGATYSVVEGANVTWTKGSSTDATVTIKRTEDDGTTFAHFTGITMDGNEVPANQYRKQPGSVVITLPAAYLETLSVGEHALVAKFDDGSVATKLTVQAAATPTPTDPDTDPTKPGTDPTKPDADPTNPGTDPTNPSTDPANPSTDPANPSTDPAKPSTDPAKPNGTGTSTTPKAHATPTTTTAKTALPKTGDESSAPLAASLAGIAALCFLAARSVKRA